MGRYELMSLQAPITHVYHWKMIALNIMNTEIAFFKPIKYALFGQ